MTNWVPDATPNFSIGELVCRCGCARADMDAAFMSLLQALRDETGPLVIASGFRCPAHNSRVSSTGSRGPHTTGKAVDIRCFGDAAHRLVAAALSAGVTGIGVAQSGARGSRFIHLDVLEAAEAEGLRPWVWSY